MPCVLIVSDNVIRWGAGTTVESAYRRALFGDHGLPEDEPAVNWPTCSWCWPMPGLDVVVVDVGTAMLAPGRRVAGVGAAHGTLTGRRYTIRYGRGTRAAV